MLPQIPAIVSSVLLWIASWQWKTQKVYNSFHNFCPGSHKKNHLIYSCMLPHFSNILRSQNLIIYNWILTIESQSQEWKRSNNSKTNSLCPSKEPCAPPTLLNWDSRVRGSQGVRLIKLGRLGSSLENQMSSPILTLQIQCVIPSELIYLAHVDMNLW